MGKQLSTTRAQAELPNLIAEVERSGEPVIIERDGRAVAALVRLSELRRGEESSPGDAPKRGALALVGLWGDVADEAIDAFVRDVYAARAQDLGRPVDLSS